MLTAQLMKAMDDGHLIAALRAEHDPLTSTAVEDELLNRFERLVDERRDAEPLDDAIESSEICADDLPAILKTMAEFYCATPEELRAKLERVDAFSNIANDAGDVITRLSQLITTAQE